MVALNIALSLIVQGDSEPGVDWSGRSICTVRVGDRSEGHRACFARPGEVVVRCGAHAWAASSAATPLDVDSPSIVRLAPIFRAGFVVAFCAVPVAGCGGSDNKSSGRLSAAQYDSVFAASAALERAEDEFMGNFKRNLEASTLSRSELADAARTAARIGPAQRRLDRAIARAVATHPSAACARAMREWTHNRALGLAERARRAGLRGDAAEVRIDRRAIVSVSAGNGFVIRAFGEACKPRS